MVKQPSLTYHISLIRPSRISDLLKEPFGSFRIALAKRKFNYSMNIQ